MHDSLNLQLSLRTFLYTNKSAKSQIKCLFNRQLSWMVGGMFNVTLIWIKRNLLEALLGICYFQCVWFGKDTIDKSVKMKQGIYLAKYFFRPVLGIWASKMMNRWKTWGRLIHAKLRAKEELTKSTCKPFSDMGPFFNQ